ncbi:MAG TPA: M28 family peptidase [Bacteroidales bacterium]
MKIQIILLIVLLNCSFIPCFTQSNKEVPPSVDLRMYDIIQQVSSDRIRKDVITLANFGTRNTFSDTISNSRGIGAATRWIKQRFDSISAQSNGGLEVFYQNNLVKKGENKRILRDVWVKNVIAIQRGKSHNYIIVSGDIDSRASDVNNAEIDAPGANDNASGLAGVLEAARILSKYQFNNSIIYAALSGEEQGLFGGEGFAAYVKEKGWHMIGILNNDMIGNIEGIDGTIDNRSFRIFSEPVPPTETEAERNRRRYMGGEVDGISRQLARYVCKMTEVYMPEMKPMMIYRLDRFGRGGHHKPFNDAGYAGVRIMEANENYNRQHQDIRIENGINYGDVVSGVNFGYASKITSINAISLAGLAWAPLSPTHVKIGGAVSPSTTLAWDAIDDPNCIGYKIYWRETIAPQWQYSRFVGKVNTYCLENIIIDNYFFGVAAIGKDGNESTIVFPNELMK